MNKRILKRVLDESDYIIKNKSTVRDVAKLFNVSKSTVHKDMQERLSEIDKDRYSQIEEIFKYHIEIRHLNGGEATKQKYINIREKTVNQV